MIHKTCSIKQLVEITSVDQVTFQRSVAIFIGYDIKGNIACNNKKTKNFSECLPIIPKAYSST